jgi:TRAP-type C4-dicarboxylate transport system permease small subunit
MAAFASPNGALERVGNRIVAVAERILALGLIVAIVLDFTNVIGRYTGAFSVLGIDEIEIYILIWIAFVGAAAVTWRRQHLRMDVFLEACPLPVRRSVAAFEMVVMLGVCGFVGIQSYAYVTKIFALGAVSDIIGVPMWIPHVAVCLSFFAMAAIVLVRGVQRVFVDEAR